MGWALSSLPAQIFCGSVACKDPQPEGAEWILTVFYIFLMPPLCDLCPHEAVLVQHLGMFVVLSGVVV